MPHRTKYAPRCDGSSDPDLWFRASADATSAAIRACNGCELRAQCLETAMGFPDDEQWGVWGGITAAGRVALRAADPDRWPVTAETILDYARPDWLNEAQTRPAREPQLTPAWEASADELLHRYGTEPQVLGSSDAELRYASVIELSFGQQSVAGIVSLDTEMAA